MIRRYFTVRLFLCFVLINSIFSWYVSAKAEDIVQHENLLYYSSSFPQTALGITKDYIIKAVEEPIELDHQWLPRGLSIYIKSLIGEIESKICTLDITGLWYIITDDQNAYLLVVEFSEEINNFEDYMKIAFIDTSSMTLNWIDVNEVLSSEASIHVKDCIAYLGNLYLITQNEIIMLDRQNNCGNVIYESVIPIDNTIRSNHAVLYNERIYISKNNTKILSIDIETGKEEFVVSATTADVINHFPEHWRCLYRYYIYNDELIYNSIDRKYTCALNLKDGVQRKIVRDRLGFYYSGANGIYVDNGFYDYLLLNTEENSLCFIEKLDFEKNFLELQKNQMFKK